jgi:hypothetical protein
MTDLRTDRAAELTGPEPLDDLRSAAGDWQPIRPAAPSVPLSRLLALAGLGPAQAAEVGAGLLAAVAERPDTGAGDITTDRIRIDVDGRVVLASEVGNHSTVPAALAEVAGCGRERDPASDDLLVELDTAVATVASTGVPAAARRLEQVCAGIDRPAVRAELAALVRALAASAGEATEAGPGRPLGGHRERPAAVPPSARPRATGRRVWAWVLSIVVLVSVVAVEIALLRDDILADVNLLLEAGRSGSAPPGAAEPDGLPVPPPAPPSAGPVAGVDLRPLEACTPGAPCAVRVLVRLVPAPDPQTVSWSFRIMDRCTGETATAPGGTVTVPAGAGQATAVGTVVLPDRPAVALVAVTDLPAAAAAAPVLAGGCGSDGSTG